MHLISKVSKSKFCSLQFVMISLLVLHEALAGLARLVPRLNGREFVLSKEKCERKKAVIEVRYDSFWASGITFKDK